MEIGGAYLAAGYAARLDAEGMMLKIGDTVWRFDSNRRVYPNPGTFSGGGAPIYRKHFEPLKIVGENKVSWIMERGWKANKKTLKGEASSFEYGGRGFFTSEQMEDDIWMHDHRHSIRTLLDRASPAQLKKVAAILGFEPPATNSADAA